MNVHGLLKAYAGTNEKYSVGIKDSSKKTITQTDTSASVRNAFIKLSYD